MTELACLLLAAAEGPNLLKNPDFRDPEEYQANWKFGSMGDEIFRVGYDAEKKAVFIASCSNEFSGYLHQYVNVKPGKRYICRAQTLLPRGRLLLYATGINGKGEPAGTEGRVWDYSLSDNPLFPHFIPREYAPGGGKTEWKTISFVLTPKEQLSRYRISVGSYFGEGILYVRLVEFRELL